MMTVGPLQDILRKMASEVKGNGPTTNTRFGRIPGEVHRGYVDLAATLGVGHRTIQHLMARPPHSPMKPLVADRWANRLGMHPWEIWHNWFHAEESA